MFADHEINSKSLLLMEENISSDPLFEVVNCRKFIDHEINSKSLLRIEENISIEPLFQGVR